MTPQRILKRFLIPSSMLWIDLSYCGPVEPLTGRVNFFLRPFLGELMPLEGIIYISIRISYTLTSSTPSYDGFLFLIMAKQNSL
jgi:hypothetical protein